MFLDRDQYKWMWVQNRSCVALDLAHLNSAAGNSLPRASVILMLSHSLSPPLSLSLSLSLARSLALLLPLTHTHSRTQPLTHMRGERIALMLMTT